MRTSFTLGLLVLLLSGAQAQEEGWKGKTVILKEGAIPLFSEEPGGPRVVLDNLRHMTYRVLEDKDNKLKLSQRGDTGWVDKAKMLPVAKAEEYFTAAIADNPHISFYYSRRAAVYYAGREYAKALEDQNETIRLNPNESAYFNNRGLTHAARREYDKAIRDYGEALRLKPDYGLALRNRGMCWTSKKDFDKALRDFTEAMQLDPREPEAHSGLASALAGKKQYAAAIASFENALRINDKMSSALNGLGLAAGHLPRRRGPQWFQGHRARAASLRPDGLEDAWGY